MLDQTAAVVNALTAMEGDPGLDTYAQVKAIHLCNFCHRLQFLHLRRRKSVISWVTTNFPTDAGGFITSYTLNADGSRTPRSFTPRKLLAFKRR